MSRRAVYMYGPSLDKGPEGQIGAGLGMTTSAGNISLVPPTLDITHTGQVEVLDGVRIQFQMTPGTEAPSEMNFFFPDFRALCMAENATHNLHNLLTLRGAARTRSARVVARISTRRSTLHGERRRRVRVPPLADVGPREDRHLSLGPAARSVRLSPRPDPAPDEQGIHRDRGGGDDGDATGTGRGVAHARLLRLGQPQREGRLPAVHGLVRRQPRQPVATPSGRAGDSLRRVDGGADAVVERAQGYVDAGDLRFAVELLNHVVFAEPDHAAAKALLASAYTTLGYGSENGPWRNFYLMGAQELSKGVEPPPLSLVSHDMLAALTIEQIFDSLAIRINGPKAWDLDLAVEWHFTDIDEHWRTTLSNGVLVPERDAPEAHVEVVLTVTLTKPQLMRLLTGKDLDKPTYDGDTSVLQSLVAVVDTVDPSFAIVTP